MEPTLSGKSKRLNTKKYVELKLCFLFTYFEIRIHNYCYIFNALLTQNFQVRRTNFIISFLLAVSSLNVIQIM